MTRPQLDSIRTFRLWEYRVSLGQLLLRSPKDEHYRQNIDIVFSGVEFLEIPSHCDGIRFDAVRAADIERANVVMGKPTAFDRIFILCVRQQRFMFVAASVRVLENSLDLFETPLQSFRHR